jgi:hypothetical protein
VPLTAEVSGSTAGAGVSTGAQEAAKEASPEGPSAQVGSIVGSGSWTTEMTTGRPNIVKVEVVSVSSGEPSDLAEVA